MTRLVRFSNNAVSKLAANITAASTTLTLQTGDGAKFPALTGTQFFMATLIKSDGTTEVVKVTARSSDTLTVVRAAEPVAGIQTAYSFSTGDRIEHRLTAGVVSSELDRLDQAAYINPLNKSANYTVTANDVTSLIRVNSTSGNITITLPDISTLTDDFDVIVAKVTGDTNTVSIARSSTDTINGAATYSLTNQWQAAWLTADRSTGTWTVISSGGGGVKPNVDTFTGAGTPGPFTLSGDPGVKENLDVFVGGVHQSPDTYTLSGTSLTLGGDVATGVKIVAKWETPLQIGVTSANLVSASDAASGSLFTTVQGFITKLLSSIGSSIVGFIQSGIGAVQRAVQDKLRDTVNVKDFGAVGDGFTDDTAEIQNAINEIASRGRGKVIFPGTHLITAAIDLPSNITVEFDTGAGVQTSTANIDMFVASNKTGITVRGGKFKSTVQGTSGTPSGIKLLGCSYCTVENNEFDGMQSNGIYLIDSSHNVVRNNYIHNASGMTITGADTCDIGCLGSGSYNTVEGNRCYSLTAIGILVQAGLNASTVHNKIIANKVNEKTGYGILVYQITPGDNWALISGNTVTDILGTHVLGASGSGIYVQSSGGAIISNNHVRNCCRSTTSSANAPAAISVASNGAARETSIIEGNIIDAPKWWGIVMSDNSGKFICKGNRVSFSDAAQGAGIRFQGASNSVISENYIESPLALAKTSLLVATTGADITGLVVTNNVINGSDGVLLNVAATNPQTISGVFSGNDLRSNGANAQGLSLNRVINSVVSNNNISCGFIGLYPQNCTNVRGAGNNCIGSGTYTILTGGTNTNVFFDSSNDFDMSNTAGILSSDGVTLEQRSNAAPSAGGWTRGSRIAQSVPTVGAPKGWMCTATGSPGTWVSEGNL